jgi:DNA segregation ATPase FtsK/SpoIIIE-like protein
MILIDPKMVELQMFATVPHLMCPVVTDARQATAVLLWAVEKMEGRYELFKAAGVKNVKAYNALSESSSRRRWARSGTRSARRATCRTSSSSSTSSRT